MARTIVGQPKLKNAKWCVMWIHKGRIMRKDFDADLAEAIRVHALLVKADRRGVTLRCTNVGFPAPEKYTRKPIKKHRIVKRNGKRYRKPYIVRKNIMGELNRQGIYWCPYCMKLRRFNTIKEKRRAHVQCPMCKITSRDWHVRHENPEAVVVEYHRNVRLRRGNVTGGKRRRKRR